MVSVIIPIYNVEKYLKQCIDSVLAQTYQDLEIILVEDGSPDHCGAICDEYMEQDRRVKVVHKKNGGLSDARNAGMNIATGEYILFLDSDDYIDNFLVETVVKHMEKGYDLVAFRFMCVNQNDEKYKGPEFLCGEWKLETNEKRKQFYATVLLKYGIGWAAWNRMFKRSLIDKMQLRYADNRRIFAEDLYFNICYCTAASRVLCIDEYLYYYRIRDDSIMGKEQACLNVGRMNELSKCAYEFICQTNDKSLLEIFPLIHFLVIKNSAGDYKRRKGMRQVKLRKEMLNDIEDKTYFYSMLKQLSSLRLQLEEFYGKCESMHILKLADYWRTGNVPLFALRTLAIRRLMKNGVE